mmetsp:Transcript_16415/g.44610  ORF Transcript_16415/g.44610 Transcript_16415/m.44610 type:complete len:116 (+) Transcript_16415:1023-1370(+)
MDGNTLADRFPRQLALESVILKQDSDNIEFWYDDAKPWIHYIPFKNDFSDLESVLEQTLANDTLMQEVASAGSSFVLKRTTPDTVKCYWANLLDEYSRRVELQVMPIAGAEQHCI